MKKASFNISEIIDRVKRDSRFDLRMQAGSQAEMWNELFGGRFGSVRGIRGNTLVIAVENAVQRYEFNNFHKDEIMEILSKDGRFSNINDIEFKER
ncbi:MAG: DUF721 domain-containing protein [Planctomycetes bacterium]|nr:DUF721 domain-containing protein [Planctomycetota bacterium]